MAKCDHCDKEAEYQTLIWFLCPQCLEDWKGGMKAQAEAQAQVSPRNRSNQDNRR